MILAMVVSSWLAKEDEFDNVQKTRESLFQIRKINFWIHFPMGMFLKIPRAEK